MHGTTHALAQYLEELARNSRPGDRFPTVRELMRRFGASQMLVQQAMQGMKRRGLIDSQVGRGTFFRGNGGPVDTATPSVTDADFRPHAAAVKSVLLLRRSISIARGRMLAEGLQRRLASDGHRALEVSYTDADHARTVLAGLPRFDACVMQASFMTVPIDLLAALKQKSDVLAVDGVAFVGADVEAVGTEWGEPLAQAVAMLQQRGHRRIAFAMTSLPFLPAQLAWRRFGYLSASLSGVELHALPVPLLPNEDYAQALANTIKTNLDSSGRPPFTALVTWGIEDGGRFRGLLSDIGIGIPASMSVVLLGRTDLANEHANFFDVVGCSIADQVETLHLAITARWAEPSSPYGVRFIPVAIREGMSVASPAQPGTGRRIKH